MDRKVGMRNKKGKGEKLRNSDKREREKKETDSEWGFDMIEKRKIVWERDTERERERRRIREFYKKGEGLEHLGEKMKGEKFYHKQVGQNNEKINIGKEVKDLGRNSGEKRESVLPAYVGRTKVENGSSHNDGKLLTSLSYNYIIYFLRLIS